MDKIIKSEDRKPLAVGNVYRFKGYQRNGFKVTAISLPGTPNGFSGVAVRWLNQRRERYWYPFSTEDEFWSHPLFSHACDPEHT